MNEREEFPSLHGISDREAEELCWKLRRRVVQVVSRTGGHLASNLGAVELTVALHRVYDTGRDRLVFDVGHQCYIHKMLTGRNGRMETLRTFGGIAGFPKPAESVHDAAIAGHASTAVSMALGMAKARTLGGGDYKVVALLGDGSLTGDVASAVRLGRLSRYVDKVLHQIARELRQGNIDADPCTRGRDDSACTYCPFAAACYFDENRDRRHYLHRPTREEFWEFIDAETGEEARHV